MTKVALETWTSFVSEAKNFLTPPKIAQYSGMVAKTLWHFKKLRANISNLKIQHYWIRFPDHAAGFSQEYREMFN